MKALQRQGSGQWAVGVPSSASSSSSGDGIHRASPGHSRMFEQRGGGPAMANKTSASKRKRSASHRFPWRSVSCVLAVCLVGLVSSIFFSHPLSHAFVGDKMFPRMDFEDEMRLPEDMRNKRDSFELVEDEKAAEEVLTRLEKMHPEVDEYDDDGGEVEVEKKAAEVVTTNRMPRLRGERDTVQTVVVENQVEDNVEKQSEQSRAQKPRRTKKRRHTATPPCEIDFRTTTEGLGVPPQDDRGPFVNVSLSYLQREVRPLGDPDWVPKFGGHQSLPEREASFQAVDQTSLHCGFVKAPKEEPTWTGFELSASDNEYLATCQIAVSSCIFGAWDNLRTPTNKKMSDSSKASVCFVMFVDQMSLDAIKEDGQVPNEKGVLGLWKIVLIKNLPYQDGRRNGKVPKLLSHRLFPNARYSIWVDSKLRLNADPLLILERFLWRGKHEYAISNHYDRHCVWEEVAQNKKLNKFSHSVIDEQFAFYRREGLPRFNESDPNRYLPSYVPEGSFIVRAHTPMANLFSCLWFNEVERFTPRDQLSFAATYIKFVRTNPTKRFHFNMFKDCERKAMAKLFHHRVDAGSAVTHT